MWLNHLAQPIIPFSHEYYWQLTFSILHMLVLVINYFLNAVNIIALALANLIGRLFVIGHNVSFFYLCITFLSKLPFQSLTIYQFIQGLFIFAPRNFSFNLINKQNSCSNASDDTFRYSPNLDINSLYGLGHWFLGTSYCTSYIHITHFPF